MPRVPAFRAATPCDVLASARSTPSRPRWSRAARRASLPQVARVASRRAPAANRRRSRKTKMRDGKRRSGRTRPTGCVHSPAGARAHRSPDEPRGSPPTPYQRKQTPSCVRVGSTGTLRGDEWRGGAFAQATKPQTLKIRHASEPRGPDHLPRTRPGFDWSAGTRRTSSKCHVNSTPTVGNFRQPAHGQYVRFHGTTICHINSTNRLSTPRARPSVSRTARNRR